MKNFIISGILSGVAILLVWMVSSTLISMLFSYDIMDFGGMRAMDDPLMLLSFLYPFVLGLAMSYVFPYVKPEGKTGVRKGLCFGALMWLVVIVPSAFMIYTSMDYPAGFAIEQLVGGLLYMLAGGAVIGKLREKDKPDWPAKK